MRGDHFIDFFTTKNVLNITNSGGLPGKKGDPGKGVPTGGAPGQVLTKKSTQDYDTDWQEAKSSAKQISYDHTKVLNPLAATNVQDAIDETVGRTNTLDTGLETLDDTVSTQAATIAQMLDSIYGPAPDRSAGLVAAKADKFIIPAHGDFDVLSVPLIYYSTGNTITVSSGKIDYSYADWVEFSSRDEVTDMAHLTLIQWSDDGLYVYYDDASGEPQEVKIAEVTGETIPQTIVLATILGFKTGGVDNNHWGGLIMAVGSPAESVNLELVYDIVASVVASQGDSLDELFATTESLSSDKIDTLLAGANVLIVGEGNSRTISVPGISLPKKFTSTASPEGAVGDALVNQDATIISPIVGGDTLAPSDIVIYSNGVQADVTSITGETYSAVIVFLPEATSWGAIGGEIGAQTDLITALSGKVDAVSGKVLSDNNYTSTDKNKLAALAVAAPSISNVTRGDSSYLVALDMALPQNNTLVCYESIGGATVAISTVWADNVGTVTGNFADNKSYGFAIKDTTTGMTVSGTVITAPKSLGRDDVGLGNVDNTSDVTKKQDFTGKIAEENTGFVTGADVYSAIQSAITSALDKAYPIGSIYMSINSINPGTLFGGTWVTFGAGRTIVGVDTSDSDFNAPEKTGGSKSVTLTTEQMPSHNHAAGKYDGTTYLNHRTASSGGGFNALAVENDTYTYRVKTDYSGSGGAHTNLQPYIAVYLWKRTA
jgi:hypothetical protein